MKIAIKNMISVKSVLCLLAGMILLTACKKDEFEATGPNRLFRPTVKGEMVSGGNWIEVSWQNVKGASSYTVQISRDTFKTIDRSLKVDTNAVTFNNLKWNQLYQLRVRAEAQDTSMNSKFSILGEMKSAKFPTIITPQVAQDIADVGVILRWTPTGQPVTSIKVLKASDSSLVREVPLTDLDRTQGFKRVMNLTGNTPYIVYLYSGENIRGWEDITTKPSPIFPTGSNIVDLRGDEDPASLRRVLEGNWASGTVVLLDPGMTYDMNSGINLSKSLTLYGAPGFGPLPSIRFSSNFNFTEGSTMDSLVFKNLRLVGTDYTGKYVLNASNGSTVGKIVFDNCRARVFRGMVRLQNKVTNVANFIINNCVIDSVGNYGVVNVDGTTPKIENITISNSTIFKTEKVVTSRNASASVIIENCTINEAPLTGNYLVDYNAVNVTNNIKLLNSILGVGKSNVNGDKSVRGYRAGTSTSSQVVGTYATSDYTVLSNEFPGLTSYSGTSSALWANPEAGDFRLRDLSFAGKSTAGDPRWRP
ncbi:DUF5123 domain-containing protein [Pedobacter sp. SYSU D00535]|uniref:DUF5123 domain-containing protein n=1 Tax=Pedobacter sp. SYSU D00535 TaxID=2810308 RepID=UPI001A96257D|nr:DUF5123 domain-containing protein [Pedobacter sp. SYSU D00535]